MGAFVRIVSSATSFRPTVVVTSRAARSVVSMIRWMAATSHSTSRVASLNKYFLPASSGRRPIQNRLHRKVGDQRRRVFVRGDLATQDEDLLVERDAGGLA